MEDVPAKPVFHVIQALVPYPGWNATSVLVESLMTTLVALAAM